MYISYLYVQTITRQCFCFPNNQWVQLHMTIDLKWNTVVLSLKDLDLPMINTLQVVRWKKTQVRKLFGSSNSYFRIVAYSPHTRKVRPLTDVCNLQDETVMDLDDQPTCAVQPLEVIVT